MKSFHAVVPLYLTGFASKSSALTVAPQVAKVTPETKKVEKSLVGQRERQ